MTSNTNTGGPAEPTKRRSERPQIDFTAIKTDPLVPYEMTEVTLAQLLDDVRWCVDNPRGPSYVTGADRRLERHKDKFLNARGRYATAYDRSRQPVKAVKAITSNEHKLIYARQNVADLKTKLAAAEARLEALEKAAEELALEHGKEMDDRTNEKQSQFVFARNEDEMRLNDLISFCLDILIARDEWENEEHRNGRDYVAWRTKRKASER